MTSLTLGDLSQSLAMKRHTTALRSDLNRLTAELGSGIANDPVRHLQGQTSALAAIDHTLARLTGYDQILTLATQRSDAIQVVLARIDDLATATGPDLLRAASVGDPVSLSMAGTTARDALVDAVAALNTRLADRTLFAGMNTDTNALVPADQILSLARAVVSPATSGADVEAALRQWFDDPAGFAAQAYLGGPSQSLALSPTESLTADPTAEDPALRATLQALILGSLVADPALPAPMRADLARRSGEQLAATATDRAHLAGRVGVQQARLDAISTRAATETAVLQQARVDLLAVDPYDTATRLQETEARLQMLYTITARLSRLSLADYM